MIQLVLMQQISYDKVGNYYFKSGLRNPDDHLLWFLKLLNTTRKLLHVCAFVIWHRKPTRMMQFRLMPLDIGKRHLNLNTFNSSACVLWKSIDNFSWHNSMVYIKHGIQHLIYVCRDDSCIVMRMDVIHWAWSYLFRLRPCWFTHIKMWICELFFLLIHYFYSISKIYVLNE